MSNPGLLETVTLAVSVLFLADDALYREGWAHQFWHAGLKQ